MVCRDFILPEPASYVFFYAVFNLRNLLYIIFFRVWGVQKSSMLGFSYFTEGALLIFALHPLMGKIKK